MARITAKAFKAKVLKNFESLQAKFRARVAGSIGEQITDALMDGRRVVKGAASRLKRYSPSYTKQIKDSGGRVKGTDGKNHSGKRVRPVNLNVSGKMHDGQRVSITRNGVEIKYTHKFKGVNIAAVHNEGDSGRNLPARRILPTKRGEVFSRNIQKSIQEAAKAEVKKTIRTINKG